MQIICAKMATGNCMTKTIQQGAMRIDRSCICQTRPNRTRPTSVKLDRTCLVLGKVSMIGKWCAVVGLRTVIESACERCVACPELLAGVIEAKKNKKQDDIYCEEKEGINCGVKGVFSSSLNSSKG